jgi:DNA/RNA-binding domain of Phe-tRNA-synthetase-like protein
MTLRSGQEGESFLSLRGPFQLDGKPLMADRDGPFGTPITDSERVKVQSSTRRVWMVGYLPSGVVSSEEASAALDDLVRQASGVERFEIGA